MEDIDIKSEQKSDLEIQADKVTTSPNESVKSPISALRGEVGESAMAVTGTPERKLSSEQQEKLISILQPRFEKHNRDPKFEYSRRGMVWSRVLAQLCANPEKMWSFNEMDRTGGEPDIVGYDAATKEYIVYDLAAESPRGRTNLVYNAQMEKLFKNQVFSKSDLDTSDMIHNLHTGEFIWDKRANSADMVNILEGMPDLSTMNDCQKRFWLWAGRLLGVEAFYAKMYPKTNNEELYAALMEPLHKCDGNAVDTAKSMGIKIFGPNEYSILQNYGDFDARTWSWLEMPDEEKEKYLGVIAFQALGASTRIYYTNFVLHSGLGSFRGVLRF